MNSLLLDPIDPRKMSLLCRDLYDRERDFQLRAVQDASIPGKLANALTGRVVYLCVSLAAHAEAVCKVACIILLKIQSLFSQMDRVLFKKQIAECKEAYKLCLHSLFACFHGHLPPERRVVFDKIAVPEPSPYNPTPTPSSVKIASPSPLVLPLVLYPEEQTRIQFLRASVDQALAPPGLELIRQSSSQTPEQTAESAFNEMREAKETKNFVYQIAPEPLLHAKGGQWTVISGKVGAHHELGICHFSREHCLTKGESLHGEFTVKVGEMNHDVKLFGIIEATLGCRAAKYTKENLERILHGVLLEEFKDNPRSWKDEGIIKALKSTFQEVSDQFKSHYGDLQLDPQCAERIADQGATATIGLIINKKLFLVHLGNGVAFLDGAGGDPIPLTESNHHELERRLRPMANQIPPSPLPKMGILGAKYLGQAACSEPHVTVTSLNSRFHGNYLILGSSKIRESHSSEEMVRVLRREDLPIGGNRDLSSDALNYAFSVWAQGETLPLDSGGELDGVSYNQMLEQRAPTLSCMIVKMAPKRRDSLSSNVSMSSGVVGDDEKSSSRRSSVSSWADGQPSPHSVSGAATPRADDLEERKEGEPAPSRQNSGNSAIGSADGELIGGEGPASLPLSRRQSGVSEASSFASVRSSSSSFVSVNPSDASDG